MADETVETIDVTPTWEGILPAFIGIIETAAATYGDPESNQDRRQSRQTAIAELSKMARLADRYVSEHGRGLDGSGVSHSAPTRRDMAASLLTDTDIDGILADGPPICDICGEFEDQDPTNGREYNWNGETGNHLSCEAAQR